eukprot:gnl/TRDRNA2_/TRDRNA2_165363_c0_seq1.p1 gnl/TRDRNA2_/TRDRNA2_165363_c0~~gnl/TRDRNA2_/TRDRNA2_165363_c0_seq1.p1  ORF type:complete len:131 (+),score=19.87 gnl/TRDRNA2_/TRDRNA2_165363_c0_seq1:37-393(+)
MVTDGQPLCEAVLWTNWIHRGRLVASTSSELFGLHAEKFRDITPKRHMSLQYLRLYASLFVSNLLEQEKNDASAISDICDDIDALQLVNLAFEVDEQAPQQSRRVSIASLRWQRRPSQ